MSATAFGPGEGAPAGERWLFIFHRDVLMDQRNSLPRERDERDERADAHVLARARAVARLLDSAVRVPGTGIRFGLDPLLGLIPGLGDLAGTVLSGYIVVLGARRGVSRAVVLRMLGNIAVDTVGGALPILGDAFDVAWKSNARNLALLERAVTRPRETRASSAWVVVAALVLLALVVVGGIALSVLVVHAISAGLHRSS